VPLTITAAEETVEAFPELEVRLVVAEGVRNAAAWPDAEANLRAVEDRLGAGQWRPFDAESERIASWHEAYRRFGTNPRRIRPSVDALGRRLEKSGRLPRINGCVDTYNYVSVLYGLPAGAFDLDRIDTDVQIRFGRAGDAFTPLGEPDAVEQPNTGEVVYAAGDLVLTRHWNHRDCDRTKVTEDSKRIVFMLERVSRSAAGSEVMDEAQNLLAELIAVHADKVSTLFLEAGSPSVAL
jgi:DNA/RNA-binding domain of Phe-tRNA-synthetase-like protein